MFKRTLMLLAFPCLLLATPYAALVEGGKIHLHGGRPEKAFDLFTQATQQEPTRPDAYLWLGLAAVQLNRFEDGAAAFDRAFTIDTTYLTRVRRDDYDRTQAWTAFIGAANSAVMSQKFEDARKWIARAIAVEPTSSQNYTLLARILVGLGKFDELKAAADKLRALQENSPEADMLYAMYYSKKDQRDTAVVFYEKAANRFVELYDQSFNDLATTLNLPADTARPIADRLIALRREGNFEKLGAYIRDTLKVGEPKRPMVQRAAAVLYAYGAQLNLCYFRAGTVIFEAGKYAAAESLLTRAIAYNPEDYDALFNLGIAESQTKKDSLALAHFKAAEVAFKEDPYLYLYIGVSEINLGRYDDAIKSLDQALKVDPNLAEAYRNLSIAYREKGDKQKALECFQKYTELSKPKP